MGQNATEAPANGWQGPIASHLGDDEQRRAVEAAGAAQWRHAADGRGPRAKVRPVLGELRLQLAEKFALIKSAQVRAGRAFLWVVDFPLFEYSEEEQRLFSVNHPFTAPHPEDLRAGWTRAARRPARWPTTWCSTARSWAAARFVFTTASCNSRCSSCWAFSREEAIDRFGFLLDALSYGAPPHGGIAFGVERICDAVVRHRLDARRDGVSEDPEGGTTR